MARRKDVNWSLGDSFNLPSGEIQIAVLMDIRDELKQLNRTLGCHNVVGGMVALQRLDRRAAKHWPLTAGRKKT